MKSIKYLTGLLAVFLLASCSPTSESGNPTIDVDTISVGELKRDTLTGTIASDGTVDYFDFYEVSDFHGAVNYSTDEKTIGLEKMADYFSKKRAENPGGTVVISGGDMYQGSAESNLTHGYIVNYSMNIMGFESMTLGNHEFDWSLAWLKKNQSLEVEGHKIPYLAANVFDKETGKHPDFISPSAVITRGEYKVGVIGTLGDGAESSIMKSLISSLEFRKEVPIVKEEAKRLREEEHCDIVVWSSHRDAAELALLGITKADGINAVFGGHSHRNFPGDGEMTTYVDGIPYLETRNIGRGIAHARVEINKSTKEVANVTGEVDTTPYLYQGLTEHAEVKKLCAIYNEKIDPIKHEVIGTTNGELDISDTFSLTDLCVDTMSQVAKEWAKNNGGVTITAAFHNANGGVRAKIAAGNITYGDVYKSFPFDNEICIVKTTGTKLKNYFRKSQAYGVWRDTTLTALADIDANNDYYFTTTDFMATSDSFVFKLKDSDLIRTGEVVRDTIAARIKKDKTISAESFRRSSNVQFQPLVR